MVFLKLIIHQSLRIANHKKEFIGEFKDKTILVAMNELLEEDRDIKDQCLQDGDRRPGLLYIAGKTELSSLGLLDEILEEDMEIRIVPILHGG